MVFSKQRLSKLGSIFDAILVPTWLHFAFPNQPKSFKNPTPRAIKILIDFCFDFFSILAPFWEPSWSHVGHFFRSKIIQKSYLYPPTLSNPIFGPFWPNLGWVPAAGTHQVGTKSGLKIVTKTFGGKRGGGFAALRRFGYLFFKMKTKIDIKRK